jgi:hypothetical protein
MLKSVSSIINAIGALNYKGTWNASTNTPTIVSSVGVKGDYYVVSVAGTTNINGISNWGVGDWITFNGSVWQRVEGGADLNGVNVSFTGVASGPTYETSNLTAGLTITDNDITADGTDADIDIDITPKGTGEVNLSKVDIDGGTIDGTVIGGSTAAAGTFTNAVADAFRMSASGIITEAGTSRTLAAGDNGKVIYCTSGSAVTITCAAGLGAGFSCTIIQAGGGQVTLAAGAATLNSYGGFLKTIGQYAVVSLISPVADQFIAAGNLGV